MAIVARLYEPRDAEAYFAIRSATYGNGVPVPEQDRSINLGRAVVCEQDGVVAGIAKILDYSSARGPALIPNAGIAGVAVSPTVRRSGVGSAMLTWMVRHIRELGFPLTSLYAFREPYYRKFGYEVAGRKLHIICPTSRLPNVSSDRVVKRLSPDDWPKIRPCYEQYAHARSGFHIRDERRWIELTTGPLHPAIYAFGDPIEAYAIIVHKINFWEAQRIEEVIWSTESGHKAVMSWFASIGANKTHIDWHEPSDSPYLARYLDQGVELKIDKTTMYRVTDVESALRRLRPQQEGIFTIRIHDEIIPENNGPWCVTYSQDGVTVEPSDTAGIEMDIRQFSVAFLGEPSLMDLARNGLVAVKSEVDLKAAAGLLTALPVGSWDFF